MKQVMKSCILVLTVVLVGTLFGCTAQTNTGTAEQATSTTESTTETTPTETPATTAPAVNETGVKLPESMLGVWEFVDDATYLVTIKPNEIISGDLYATYTTEYFDVVSYDTATQTSLIKVKSILSEGEEAAVTVNADVTLILKDDVLTIKYAQSEEIDATESQWVRVKK